MSDFYISYLDLSPGLENPFVETTHHVVVNTMRKYFLNWLGFFAKYEGYSLGFIVCTDRGIEKLEVKGPSISRKMKIVDFSIFLPEKVDDVSHYLDLVFSGIALALSKYKVTEAEIERIKEECKHELGVG